jgi:hypothetical protein
MRAVSKKVMKSIQIVPFVEKANELYSKIMENTPKMVDLVWKINKRFPGKFSTPSLTGPRYTAYLSLYGLEGFKCEELTEVLEFLISLDPKGTSSNEYPGSFNIDYHFDFEYLKLSVFAHVKQDSQNCRRVVVGEETITQYKYELVCD